MAGASAPATRRTRRRVDLILKYDALFADGWDAERERRLARQIELGIVPPGTRLPPRNDAVQAWAELSPTRSALYTRLQEAYAAMLDHADQHIARLIALPRDSRASSTTR